MARRWHCLPCLCFALISHRSPTKEINVAVVDKVRVLDAVLRKGVNILPGQVRLDEPVGVGAGGSREREKERHKKAPSQTALAHCFCAAGSLSFRWLTVDVRGSEESVSSRPVLYWYCLSDDVFVCV